MFDMAVTKKKNIDSIIVGVVFVLSILLPHKGVLYLINPLLLLFLAYRYSSIKRITLMQIAMAIIIVLSLSWNFFAGVDISSKSFVRLFYILELLLFFPFCGNHKLPNVFIYFVVVIILLSQICYVYNVGVLIDFFNQLYPYTGSLDSESADYLVSQSQEADSLSALEAIRFGGLFHNPNQCMKYISLCSVAFILENHGRRLITFLPFFAIVGISSVLSGSRTGFVIVLSSLAIALAFRFVKYKVAILLVVILSAIIVPPIFSSLKDDYRLFQISSGLSSGGSISLKYANLHSYLQRVDSFRALVVGNASIESIKELYGVSFTKFDSEWGNAIYYYGILFTIIYFSFLIQLVIRLKGYYRIAGLILLWIISSTILFSFRTSFAFMFILSKYLNASFSRQVI